MCKGGAWDANSDAMENSDVDDFIAPDETDGKDEMEGQAR
jgi:hypothetical protein